MMRKIPARLYFGFIVISLIGLTVAAQGIYQLSGIEQQRVRIAGFTASLSRNEETSFNLETILRKEARTRSERDEGTWVELKDLERQVSLHLTAAMATLSSYRRQLYQSVIQAMSAHDESIGHFKQQQDASAIYRGKLALEGDGLVAAMDKLVASAAGEAETALAAKAEAAVLMLQVTNLRFQTVQNHAGPESFRASLEKASRSLASLSDAANGPNKALVAEVQVQLRAYAADFAVFAEAYLNSIAIYDQQLSPQVAAMQKNLKSAEASLKTAVAAATADSESLIASATLISEILASGGFMLSLLLAFLIGRSISRPLSTMTTAMARLAGQDMEVNVPGIGRRDEIGTMAKAVQLFKEAGLEKRRLEASAIAQAEAVEAEQARVEVERATSAKQQSIVVEELAKGLAYLAGGDLTYILAHEFAPDYERLRDDFNAAVRELHQAICAVVTSTRSISQETGRVAEAAEKLSARTDGHAVSLQGTVKALGEITATIRKTAQGAMRASLVVARTKTDAEQSGEVVRQAIGAMATIEQSSSQISQIIGVIDEIAFQTNLLALNAGVEAARAGDSGRGFAVVASEVRALAQRSAQAAKEIKALISTSSGQVDMGVQLVGKAGQALARIVTQVVEITEAVSEMAVAAQQQSAGLNEVFSGVSEMEKLTHENASMVAESTVANQALARETVELVRLAERFRIDDQGEAPDGEHGGTARRVA